MNKQSNLKVLVSKEGKNLYKGLIEELFRSSMTNYFQQLAVKGKKYLKTVAGVSSFLDMDLKPIIDHWCSYWKKYGEQIPKAYEKIVREIKRDLGLDLKVKLKFDDAKFNDFTKSLKTHYKPHIKRVTNLLYDRSNPVDVEEKIKSMSPNRYLPSHVPHSILIKSVNDPSLFDWHLMKSQIQGINGSKDRDEDKRVESANIVEKATKGIFKKDTVETHLNAWVQKNPYDHAGALKKIYEV